MVREKRGKQTLIKPIAPLKVLTIDDVRLAPSQCRSIDLFSCARNVHRDAHNCYGRESCSLLESNMSPFVSV